MEEMENHNEQHSDELFSKSVRAGKRTYFFDVRSTRGNDYYLTITESKKKFTPQQGGKAVFEKHKIFLYKEDFEKFIDGLHEAIGEIRKVQPIESEKAAYNSNSNNENHEPSTSGSAENSSFTNIDFDDLK